MNRVEIADNISAKPRSSSDLERFAGEQSGLFRFTDRLSRALAMPEIYEAALDAIIEMLHCDRASILIFDDENMMRFVAWRGLSQSYRMAVEGHSPWKADDRNASPISINDIEKSDQPESLKKTITGEGIRALSFIPLVVEGKLLGKFMTYFDRPHVFSTEETDLALIVARQLGFAIARMRAEDARKRADDALRRERELLRTILDRIPVMITIYEPGTKVLGINPEFQRVTGWSAEEATGISLMEHCYPDPLYREQISKFMQACDEQWMDIRMHTRDGRDIETTWANVKLSGGMQVGIGLDISVRKRAEAKLRHSEGEERARAVELQTIIDSVPAAIWIARDPECRVITGNSASFDLLRMPPGANLSLTAPEDERPTHFDVYSEGKKLEPHELPVQRAARGETVRNFDEEIRFKDGASRHVLGNATPLVNSEGEVYGAVAAFVDITHRKISDDARQFLAAIVASSEDAIISKDLNGVIVSWNDSAQRLFGYTAEEAIGKPVTILIPEDRYDEEPGILSRIRRGERVEHYETIRRRKDGTLLDISLTISPIRNDAGEVIGASKIARDITSRKQVEAQRDLLVAELSHRVKNTLATVISIARQSFASPDKMEAQRTFDSRIRALAQTHTRLAESNWSGVLLETILRDELAPYRHEDGSNVALTGARVEFNPKCALTLGLAIHELATNAAKYGALSEKNGIVHVDWTLSDRTLDMVWRETGGPPVETPKRSGFGRLLLERALASDLRGKVEMHFAREGLECRIAIPASECVDHP